MDTALQQRMRSDWNRRAQEDAHYYVAFGRHEQDDEEFFSTAHEVVYALEYELQRLPNPAAWRQWRALEIGCGVGRIMKPLSRHFGEIHGVDVSDEMMRRAQENLRSIPHAHAHLTEGASLAAFADESFDLVYSYAVFQHIPSAEVIFTYLDEARRVLKTGGLLWFQVNGLPGAPPYSDTWSGARISAEQLSDFAAHNDFQIYAMEGVETQYMWTSWRKRPPGWFQALLYCEMPSQARVVRVTNKFGTEPIVPCAGRQAVAALWIENLPVECGLNHLEIGVEGAPGIPHYIGARLPNGQQQVNVSLPQGVRTGLVPVQATWLKKPLCPPAIMRVTPPGPRVPRVMAVTDAVDLLSGTEIYNGAVRVVTEELLPTEPVEFRIDERLLEDYRVVCTEPRAPRLEFFVRLDGIGQGIYNLQTVLRGRAQAPVEIQVMESRGWSAPH